MPCNSSCWSPSTCRSTSTPICRPGNVVRSGIEFDSLGGASPTTCTARIPEDGRLAPMSGQGGWTRCASMRRRNHPSVPRAAPGQIAGRAVAVAGLVKLNELDQYDDAELVRKKTAAMFAGFVTRQNPEDNLMGEGAATATGRARRAGAGHAADSGAGRGHQVLRPADVGGSYSEFLRNQFRAVAAAIGITLSN